MIINVDKPYFYKYEFRNFNSKINKKLVHNYREKIKKEHTDYVNLINRLLHDLDSFKYIHIKYIFIIYIYMYTK